MRTDELRVNPSRLWDMLMRSGEIGRTPSGGLRRWALSDADKQMRDQFVSWSRHLCCEVRIDQAGNIFVRYPGREDLPPVAIGSHLDTAAVAGLFDGILGVLGGLEAVWTLADHQIRPKRPIEVVVWTNEEGTRFPHYISGSLVFTGERSLDWLYGLCDRENRTFKEELQRIGYAGQAPVGGHVFDSYFELHIEQGPLLDEANIPLGVVIGAAAVRGAYVKFRGQAAHPGGTPMARRKNALIGAATLIAAVNDIGWKLAPIGRTTATRLDLWPNMNGTIPSLAETMVDMRHEDPSVADRMYAEMVDAARRCASEANLEVEIHGGWRYGGRDVAFDPECIDTIRNAAKRLNVPTLDLYSQAGHDAYPISRVAPTAMLFCPCVDGLSHSEAERIVPDQTWPAVNTLLQTVLARANR